MGDPSRDTLAEFVDGFFDDVGYSLYATGRVAGPVGERVGEGDAERRWRNICRGRSCRIWGEGLDGWLSGHGMSKLNVVGVETKTEPCSTGLAELFSGSLFLPIPSIM